MRNWTDRVESRNIRFQNCEFYKSGADELLAVWGWGGAVRDVVLSGCSFYETQTQEALDADHRPVWFITLGQSGTTDVRMEDCTVRAEYCETIFRMVGRMLLQSSVASTPVRFLIRRGKPNSRSNALIMWLIPDCV